MSSVAVVRRLLTLNDELMATLPGSRVFSSNVPLNTTLPAIRVTEVSTNQRNTVSMDEPDRAAFSRVQVTVYADNYPQKKQILDLVRKAMPNTRGMMVGVMVLSITPQGIGPDIDNTEDKIYIQSRDFRVSYIE